MRAVFFLLLFSFPVLVRGAERIVSLSPALTRIAIFAGGREKLVGVTDFYRGSLNAERVGGIVNPSVEKILSLKPDAVIATTLTPERILERIKSRGIPVYLLNLVSIKDTERAIEVVGNLVGGNGKESRKLFRKLLNAQIAKISRCLEGKKVAVLISPFPVYTAGTESYIGEALSMAGARVIPRGTFVPVSPEFLRKEKPDIVIVTFNEAELPLPRESKSVFVDRDLFLQPGPSFVEGLKVLEERLCGKP